MRSFGRIDTGGRPMTTELAELIVRGCGRTRRERRKLRADIREMFADDLAAEQATRTKPMLCGATTRTGTPCMRKGHGRGGRCPNHGGRSTGPRTPEGRARIGQASRERWARQREARAIERSG